MPAVLDCILDTCAALHFLKNVFDVYFFHPADLGLNVIFLGVTNLLLLLLLLCRDGFEASVLEAKAKAKAMTWSRPS